MIVNDEILYFLITDSLRQEKMEFPVKAIFMITNDNPRYETIPSIDDTFIYYICERNPEAIVNRISELAQCFNEENIFLIDRHLSLSSNNFSKIYQGLLKKYKSVFFINFTATSDDDVEDFSDISLEKNSITLFDKIEEFNDKDFSATEH